HDIVEWRNNLRLLGYPETIWRPLLTEFEDEKLSEIGGRGRAATHEVAADGYSGQARCGAQLVKALDAYRVQSGQTVPRVTYNPSCGAGEISVRITTSPPGARVLFIPAFYYYLCQSQNIDADDTKICNYWRDQPEGMLA